MEIEIANKIFVRNAPQNVLDELTAYLTISNPIYEEALKQGKKGWGIDPLIYNFDQIYNGIAIPRGCRRKLFKLVEDLQHINIIDSRTNFKPNFDIDSSAIIYRPYQKKTIFELIRNPEGVLVAPAGSGKTIMMLSLLPLLGAHPMLWLTHTNPLMRQVLNRVKQFLPSLTGDDVGSIGAGKFSCGKIFTAALVQTLIRRKEKLDELKETFDIVIVDECHRVPSTTFTDVINQLSARYLYGATATVHRRDSLESLLFQNIGEIGAEISVDEVKKYGGIMTPTVRYKFITHSKKLDGNNIQKLLKEHIIWNKKRNNTIVGDVIREAIDGHYCIVLSDRKDHTEILYDLIKIGWEKTGIATGNYTKKVVEEQIKKLEEDKITVLVCTSALLSEGFDVPKLDRGFITMPFRAMAKAIQILGRISRVAKGKEDAVLMDYVDKKSVFENQFYSEKNDCRYKAYEKAGANIEPY